jgi:hypothetical protein
MATLGNVQPVCAGDYDGDGAREVLTTSAEGKVHIFNADGKKLKDLGAGRCASRPRPMACASGACRSHNVFSSRTNRSISSLDCARSVNQAPRFTIE